MHLGAPRRLAGAGGEKVTDTEPGTEFDRGLSSAEAAGRLQQFGPNAVAQPAESWLRTLAGKLWAPLPWMLEATILLELFVGHRPQALLILLLL